MWISKSDHLAKSHDPLPFSLDHVWVGVVAERYVGQEERPRERFREITHHWAA